VSLGSRTRDRSHLWRHRYVTAGGDVSAEVVTVEEFEALAARVADLEARIAEPAVSEWLTIRGAAEYLDLSEPAIRKLIDRGRIPKHQHTAGGRIMLRRDEIDRCLR
jgi:excisionase family DNA binding protein